MSKRRDDWIDDDEYPDDRDVDDFGEESPWEYDRRSIGYIPGVTKPFWTPGKIIVAVIALLILAALILPSVVSLLRR
jgi:hypothetical protein